MEQKIVLKSFIMDKNINTIFDNYSREVKRSRKKLDALGQKVNYSRLWQKDFIRNKIEKDYFKSLASLKFQRQRKRAKNENTNPKKYQYKRPEYLKMLKMDYEAFRKSAKQIKRKVLLTRYTSKILNQSEVHDTEEQNKGIFKKDNQKLLFRYGQ